MTSWRNNLIADSGRKKLFAWGYNMGNLGVPSVGHEQLPTQVTYKAWGDIILDNSYLSASGRDALGRPYAWGGTWPDTPKLIANSACISIARGSASVVLSLEDRSKTIVVDSDGSERELQYKYHTLAADTGQVVGLADEGVCLNVEGQTPLIDMEWGDADILGFRTESVSDQYILFVRSKTLKKTYVCGSNTHGELGIGANDDAIYNTLTSMDIDFESISICEQPSTVSSGVAFKASVFGLDSDGYLYAWGYRFGNIPKKIGNKKWRQVSVVDERSCAFLIDEDYYAYAMDYIDSVPTVLESDMRFKKIGALYSGWVGIDIDGYLYQYGRTGAGENYNSPSKISNRKWCDIHTVCNTAYDKSSVFAITE